MAMSGCGKSAADLHRTVRLHVVQQHMAGCRPDVQALMWLCTLAAAIMAARKECRLF